MIFFPMRLLNLFKGALLSKNRSLKTKMALSVSALFVISAMVRSFFAITCLENEFRKSVAKQQNALALSIADSLDDKLHTAQQTLLAVSTKLTPAMLDDHRKAQYFLDGNDFLRTIFTDNLFLLDAHGTLVAEVSLKPDLRGQNFAFREYFRKTISRRESFISSPFRTRTAGQQPVIAITAPIFDSRGKLTFMLVGSMRLIGTNFLGELPRMKIGRKGYPFLITAADGTFIMHPDPKRILKPAPPPGVNKLFDRALAGFEGSGDTVNSYGIAMLTSFRHLRSTTWILGVNLPADEAYAGVYQLRLYLAGGIAVGTLVTLVIVWLLMERLTRPLVNITRQVEGMDGGEELNPVDCAESSYEIRTLKLAFNNLIETVQRQQETLRQNERKYRIVADNTYDWECWLSPERRFIYSSPSCKRITGYENADFLDDPELLERVIHPDDKEIFEEHRRCAEGFTGVHQTEFRIVRNDGAIRWVSHLCQPIYNENGVLLGLRCSNSDITDQKHFETELQQSEERYRILVESSPDAVMLHCEGVIIYVNGAACRLFGAQHPYQLIGSQVLATVPPEYREQVSERIITAADGQVTSCHEEKVLRLDGISTDVETVETHFVYQGQPAVQVILRDISSRKQAEQALKESERTLKNLMELMPVGVALVRTDGSIEYINRCFEEKFGYTLAEIPTVKELYAHVFPDPSYHDQQVAELDANLAEAQANGASVVPIEFDVTCKDHAVRHIILNRQLVGSRRMSICTDITEREFLQNEHLKAQKLESLGVLAGGIAHDFNNILTGILGNISFARMLLDERHKASVLLEQAEKASLRAAELATQLLTFAKGGAPVKKSLALLPLLEESLSLALRGAKVKGILSISGSLWAVEADEGQISQAFNNVILNAKQAMPDGGTLTVSGENVTLRHGVKKGLPQGDYVMLRFSDEGDGIPIAIQQKIFDPYFTTKPKGTGLGLASVHSIVAKHGGQIEVDSAPGKGSVFTFMLPRGSEVTSPPIAFSKPVSASAKAGERVLIMDDEALILDLARQLLEHLGYVVTPCTNGERAIELYREARAAGIPFFAAIMDLTVPGAMGGEEASRLILEGDPAARLIVSSGYSNDPVMADFRKYGFYAAITKPYKGQDLAQVLATLA
jgi:two-component system, cell cycle sensor histidine kinase and response regulator CckA